MNKLPAIFLGLVLSAAAAAPSLATGVGMMQKPTCAAGDPVVGVNMSTKMYMTHAQMKAKMANMTQAQIHAAMQKNNVKLMCQSQAVKMGAKPTTSTM